MPEEQPHSERTDVPLVTTVADSSWKARIEPYATKPTMDVAPGVIGCVFCANTKFRRSRVRFHDLRELLMLRYPMRCMRCNQRQYGYYLTAALASAAKSQNSQVARGSDTWKAWTESEMNGQPLQRPMTTSVGTRATKLQPLPGRGAPNRQSTGDQAWRDDDHQIW